MLSQADLKRARALQEKKHRYETRRFLVQGRKVVAELLASSFRTEMVLATEEAAELVAPLAAKKKVPVHVLPEHELDRIGTFEKGNELVAIAVSPDQPRFRAPGEGELVLALDGVRDPRNLGGLLRIADWFGVRQVLCSQDCIEVYNPKVVQSTMGSLFRVEVRYARLIDELPACAAAGASVYFADMDGASVYDVELRRPAVLVLGSESHGLSEAVREMLVATVLSIPRVGRAESLNVAMAATALCTEFARQARPPRGPGEA
jgi:TrmH family RNA methyltransferase